MRLAGGMQDNGTAATTGQLVWTETGGGDGAACATNLGDPDPTRQFQLVSSQWSSVEYLDGNGNRFGTFDPYDCSSLPGCGDRSGFDTVLRSDPSDPMG